MTVSFNASRVIENRVLPLSTEKTVTGVLGSRFSYTRSVSSVMAKADDSSVNAAAFRVLSIYVFD